MSTGTPFLAYEHPVDGEISLTVVKNVVRFACRWPFDLSTDEWIHVHNEFECDTYAREVAQLTETGRARVEGRDSGHIAFAALSADEVQVDVLGVGGERACGFQVRLQLSASDLVPGSQEVCREHGSQ